VTVSEFVRRLIRRELGEEGQLEAKTQRRIVLCGENTSEGRR